MWCRKLSAYMLKYIRTCQKTNSGIRNQFLFTRTIKKGGIYLFMERLKIKYFTDQITHLEYIEGKSDWIDLRASEDIELKQGEFKLVPLGIAVKLPEGYEAHIVPRSSTYKNFGIIQANSCGIIDSSYCGDNDMWRMPVIAIRDTKIHINDRICQFRIFKNQPRLVFEETRHLEGTDRGGFGSTGIS